MENIIQMYCTEISAYYHVTGKLLLWTGPLVPGTSFEDAQQYCEDNGLGYCKVNGIHGGTYYLNEENGEFEEIDPK